ncbi:MAG: hypothetical protein EXQ74_04920 [Thermoleophilia bacterium]|nr:hypothetical protein [Thermoleophilia bacterium]
MPRRIASASVSQSLLDTVDDAAARRGITRNAYIVRALEAATDGRLRLRSEEARAAEAMQLQFASDRAAMRERLKLEVEAMRTRPAEDGGSAS